MSKLLTRTDLLKKQKLRMEKVELGEEGYVYVREMTGSERDAFEQSLIQINEKGEVIRNFEDFRAKLAVYCVCDENGNLIFKPEDYKVLSQNIKASWLNKIVEVAQRLNAITDRDVEEMAKNLKNAPSGYSISG